MYIFFFAPRAQKSAKLHALATCCAYREQFKHSRVYLPTLFFFFQRPWLSSHESNKWLTWSWGGLLNENVSGLQKENDSVPLKIRSCDIIDVIFSKVIKKLKMKIKMPCKLCEMSVTDQQQKYGGLNMDGCTHTPFIIGGQISPIQPLNSPFVFPQFRDMMLAAYLLRGENNNCFVRMIICHFWSRLRISFLA